MKNQSEEPIPLHYSLFWNAFIRLLMRSNVLQSSKTEQVLSHSPSWLSIVSGAHRQTVWFYTTQLISKPSHSDSIVTCQKKKFSWITKLIVSSYWLSTSMKADRKMFLACNTSPIQASGELTKFHPIFISLLQPPIFLFSQVPFIGLLKTCGKWDTLTFERFTAGIYSFLF